MATAKSKAKAAAGGLKARGLKARVLVTGIYGLVNDVAAFESDAELKEAVASGAVDADPAAVEYAESLVVEDPSAE